MTSTPLGFVVRWCAGIRASVHAKLLSGFLLILLLFIAMGAMGLQTIAKTSRQSQQMHMAHDRGDWSLQMEHAVAMQMNFTSLALVLRDEATIGRILRENNRFNNTLARIEEAAPADERELSQRIRAAQEDALTTVADIANLVRDGKLAEATKLHLGKEYPLYVQIEALVNQVVRIEQDKMDQLRHSVDGGSPTGAERAWRTVASRSPARGATPASESGRGRPAAAAWRPRPPRPAR